MSTLDNLESRLQNLLEVQLIKYLPGYKVEDRVYLQLATCMHNNLREQGEKKYAPNMFVIIANRLTIAPWQNEPSLVKNLAEAIQYAGDVEGFHFLSKPTVSTAEDENMENGATQILATFSSQSFTETHGLPVESHAGDSSEKIPANAFLVLDGTNIIPLDFSVINIGRRLNNQIIINDKRVSRLHAQLRVSRGRFTLFDLNSTGGTFVNGKRINKSILYPGDVISLGGVALIYGQDLPLGRGTQKVVVSQKAHDPSAKSVSNLHTTVNGKNKKPKIL